MRPPRVHAPIEPSLDSVEGSPDLILPPHPLPSPQDELVAYRNRLASKPSLLSAGAEFYYSPFSHVIGMSTGLRFTTLASHIKPASGYGKPLAGTSLLTPANIAHSSFPYTMTLTLNPLVGSISSSYSVKPTPSLALSSRCDFNFYSWESRYVVGAEMWRGKSRRAEDPVAWARAMLEEWFTPEEKALKDATTDREEENVLKFRVDDAWHFKALWTGRVKALLVSAGVSVSPVAKRVAFTPSEGDGIKRWTGSVWRQCCIFDMIWRCHCLGISITGCYCVNPGTIWHKNRMVGYSTLHRTTTVKLQKIFCPFTTAAACYKYLPFAGTLSTRNAISQKFLYKAVEGLLLPRWISTLLLPSIPLLPEVK